MIFITNQKRRTRKGWTAFWNKIKEDRSIPIMEEELYFEYERKYKFFYRPPSKHFWFSGYCYNCYKKLDNNYVWKIVDKTIYNESYYAPYCCEQCYVADVL